MASRHISLSDDLELRVQAAGIKVSPLCQLVIGYAVEHGQAAAEMALRGSVSVQETTTGPYVATTTVAGQLEELRRQVRHLQLGTVLVLVLSGLLVYVMTVPRT